MVGLSTVPEDHGGLGLGLVDLVPLLEEAGRVALPEPLLETAALAAPLLAELSEGRAEFPIGRTGSAGPTDRCRGWRRCRGRDAAAAVGTGRRAAGAGWPPATAPTC